ncbi:MAG: hypothetical protein Q8O89_00085 [Nanoarchaeota archaeon]|nr:hypothetical protein [Nanoarchaeota archaeon]
MEKNKFKETVAETGLNQDSLDRLVLGFGALFPGNREIDLAYANVLENMDPNCLPEITHCIDVAKATAFLGQVVLNDPEHATRFGFCQSKQEQLDGVILAALFHDIALCYDRDKLQIIKSIELLHRWVLNNGNPQDTDSYRGALILEREVSDKTGLSDKSVGIAIGILKNHGQLEFPWQTLVKFGDALAYINGDNHSRAVIESYLLRDHIHSYRAGNIDDSVLGREINFWKDIGIIEYGSKFGTSVRWNHEEAKKRMEKKGFLLLDYIRENMPDVYTTVVAQTEAKKRIGFIAPDVWAIRNYQAALDVLSNGEELPQDLANKLFEAHQAASELSRFYIGGEQR